MIIVRYKSDNGTAVRVSKFLGVLNAYDPPRRISGNAAGTLEIEPGVGVWMYLAERTWTCIPWHRIAEIEVITEQKDLA